MTGLTKCNAGDCPNEMMTGQDRPGEPGYCLEHLEEVILANARPTRGGLEGGSCRVPTLVPRPLVHDEFRAAEMRGKSR